jgi:hypothetical protein
MSIDPVRKRPIHSQLDLRQHVTGRRRYATAGAVAAVSVPYETTFHRAFTNIYQSALIDASVPVISKADM